MKIEINDEIVEKAIRSNMFEVKEPFNISDYDEEDILDSIEYYIKEEIGSIR